MCGIFGCNLKPGANKKAALAKLKILGIYNITRGRDSTGIFINGEIVKSTKEFDDFIEETVFNEDFENNTIIAHNRQGSAGYKKTIEEAHPYLINENLVFTHNGTIRNVGDLCKKYNIVEKDYKTDTEVLGTLLYTEGHKVLEDYKGAAALAYTKLDEPNTLYLYHGESKDYKTGPLNEERPLFYMETAEGLFYSSLESSLKAIKEDEDEKPEILNYNRIFVIRDGAFELDEVVKINREEANVYVHVPAVTTPTHSTISHGFQGHNRSGKKYNDSVHVGIKGVISNHNARIGNIHSDLRMVFKESIPIKVLETVKDGFKIYGEQFIYPHQGRYWIAPRTLAEGPMYVKKKGGIISKQNSKDSELLFFHAGVMLKDREAYQEILALKNRTTERNWIIEPKSYNWAEMMSRYSIYPVTNLERENNHNIVEHYRFAWYKGKKSEAHDSFTPKFSARSYTIKNGILTSIKSSHKREYPILATMQDAQKQIDSLTAPKKETGVQGGDSALLLPFPTPKKGSKEDLERDFMWFFETVYKDMESILNTWQEEEFETLYKFIAYAYKRDYSIEGTPKEIKEMQEWVISAAIKQNVSIATYISADDHWIKATKDHLSDSDRLFAMYSEVRSSTKKSENLGTTIIAKVVTEDDNAKGPVSLIVKPTEDDTRVYGYGPGIGEFGEFSIQDALKDAEEDAEAFRRNFINNIDHSGNIQAMIDAEADIDDEAMEDDLETEKEDIENSIENCINAMEDVKVECKELKKHGNSTMALEVAEAINFGINNTLANLSGPLFRHGKSDLEKRVNKIRDIKIEENGII